LNRISIKLVFGIGVIAAGLVSPAFGPDQMSDLHRGHALAETSATAEKEAFEAAKELGTVEAWNAFLAHSSKGFHADLARAYLKKLSGQPQAVAPPPDDFPVVAGSWGGVVRDGPGQDHRKVDSLREGQSVTLMARTDVMQDGYPWFKIAYEGDGRGYQWGGILCSTGAERPDLFKTCPPDTGAKRQTGTRESPKGCGSGRVRIDGKCVEKGAAAGYCGPGYPFPRRQVRSGLPGS
jgi:hypothetical protein